jgi:hypothetical protein
MTVGHGCPGQVQGQRDSLPVGQHMALRARFAAIRRIRAGPRPPFFAGMAAESMQARDQSIWSASPSRSNKTRCRRRHTPAACQSRRRRQQVIPLPQPSSWGSHSQGIPVRSTNTIPVNTARSGRRGRPPRGRRRAGGSRGATTAHSSSDTIGFIQPPRQLNC